MSCFFAFVQFQLLHLFSDPGPTPDPALILYQVFVLTLCNLLILCMSFLTTEKCFLFCQCVVFAQQWLLHFFLLGQRSLNTLDFICLFRFVQHVSERPGSTRCSGCSFSGETLPLWWGGTTHLVPPHFEAQFTAAGIRSQRLKYANALASLPKQVLWDIVDTIDVCNNSDQPFDNL